MEMMSAAQLNEIYLTKRSVGILSLPGRIMTFFAGITLILISFPCMFTLFLVPLAIILWILGGILIFTALINAKMVSCPECNRKQPVADSAHNFECHQCKRLTVITWIQE